MGYNFLDEFDVGQRLRSVVEELGEIVEFKLSEEEIATCKMCLNNSISTYNISATTVFKFEGEMIFEKPEYIENLRGLYFTRNAVKDKDYILVSTTETPYVDTLANIEVVECNKKVSIGGKYNDYNPATGNYDLEVKDIRYEDIKVYSDTSAKQPKESVAGDIPTTIITLTIPAQYKITTADTIWIKEFIAVGKDIKVPEYAEQEYNVIYVDDTYASTKDGINFQGVFLVDIMKEV